MAYVQIGTLLILFFTSLMLLLWIFRPNSTKLYEEISRIPLEEEKLNQLKKREKLKR